MFYYSSFAGVSLPLQQLNMDVGAGQIDTGIFLDLPGGGVYDALGENQAMRKGQVVTHQGAISALSQTGAQLETQERALRALLGKHGTLTRKWDSSGNSETCLARCLGYSSQRNPENLRYLFVNMTFELLGAVWKGTAHDDTTTLNTSPKSITVNNGGNAPVDDIVMTIRAYGTNITALTIARQFGGVTLNEVQYVGVINTTQNVIIDFGAKSVRNFGVGDYDHFSFGSNHKQDAWMRLDPGNNTIIVTKTGGGSTSTIEIAFSDGHL